MNKYEQIAINVKPAADLSDTEQDPKTGKK